MEKNSLKLDVNSFMETAVILPEGEELLWGQEQIEIETSTREKICLNGLWKFWPVNEVLKLNREDKFGIIRVPGAWSKPISWEFIPGMVAKGEGDGWGEDELKNVQQGIFERVIYVPDSWVNSVIALKIERYIPTIEVFIDDISCGEINFQMDTLDISKYLTIGKQHKLKLHTKDGYGLTGDIFLVKRPLGCHVEDVFVKTSVRKKEIALEIELLGMCNEEKVNLVAELINENNDIEICFKETKIIHKNLLLKVNWEWDSFKLWDLGSPNTYKLLLKIQGDNINDVFAVVFGFREFWIKGRDFYLNGTIIRLRPIMASSESIVEVIDNVIDGYLECGFNMAEIWPRDEVVEHTDLWCENADKKGFLMSAPVGNISKFMKNWDSEEVRSKYSKIMMKEVKRLRNHPSIIMWGTNANQFGSGLGMDPRTLGVKRDQWYNWFYWRKKRVPSGEEAIAMIKKSDPTRPVFTHHGGGVGDVYTLNMYLNLTPLQEREEWLSYWSKHSDMPFMVVEFGTPLHVTFLRGRTDFGDAVSTEPLLTEFCSIYLGKKAYELEKEEYRKAISENFIKEQKYRSWHYDPVFDFALNMQELQYIFNKNTWRSWRTMGVTGGMIPWHNGHGFCTSDYSNNPFNEETVDLGVFKSGRKGYYERYISRSRYYGMSKKGSVVYNGGKAIIENNGPTLAWIGGKAPEFTLKDHNFFSGEIIEKQVILLNDTRNIEEYSYEWKVYYRDMVIDQGKGNGTIGIGETLFIPFKFETSTLTFDSALDLRSEGKIILNASIGDSIQKDEFKFTVYRELEKLKGNLYAFDDEMSTTSLLKLCGYKALKWKGQLDIPLLIIGRNQLKNIEYYKDVLKSYVEDGGRLLIFNQDPQLLREMFGLRVCHHITRRAYAVDDNHYILKGLNEDSFRDWRGSSNLLDKYPEYEPKKTKLGKWWFPYHGYHWGNNGGVSSSSVEKPHYSGWTPILECEFDLSYSPLMELGFGKGRVILCTLDLEDHEQVEPTASILTKRIITYALSQDIVPKANKVGFIGNNQDKDLLNEIGIIYEDLTTIKPGYELILIGEDTKINSEEINNYLNKGGKLFFLPRKVNIENLGVNFEEVADFGGSLCVPNWEECKGISTSDLRYRTSCKTALIKSGGEIAADGLLSKIMLGTGIALICQIDPRIFDAEKKTFYRLTRWRTTRAVMQLLSNMGATFKMDSKIFNPSMEEKVCINGTWVVGFDGSKDFENIKLPVVWEKLGGEWECKSKDIIVKKEVMLPENWAGRDLKLSLGKIDNTDKTYFNDVLVSEVTDVWPKNYPRIYNIPGELVKSGVNVLEVRIVDRERVFDAMGGGGFAGPEEDMYIKLKQNKGGEGFYHYDYRDDYIYGDDPYRYFNW